MADWRKQFQLPGRQRRGATSPLLTLPSVPRLPKVHVDPIFRRGPKELQRTLLAAEIQQQAIPRPEVYLGTEYDGNSLRQVIALGSAPEWAFFWGLMKNGLMPDSPEGFDYQNNKLGGRTGLGGAVLDFYMFVFGLGVNIQGVYFHYELGGTAKQASDMLQRQALAGYGITLIFVDDDKALADPIGIATKALAGIDESRAIRGY